MSDYGFESMSSQPMQAPELAKSVLVVEDQRLVAADLAVQLRSFGYRVVGLAASGAEAVRKAEQLAPDLVLMDIHLEGEMDGTEAARRIRQVSNCAIVFLTAYSDVETLERAKLAEPGGYVVKPATPVELRCAVEVALYKQSSERQRSDTSARAFGEQLDEVRMRVQQLEQAYRELETFSSSLTHDLRNPLQVITGATDMLERTQGEYLSDMGRVFLGQVGSAADRMMERLGSLLEHARATRAELDLRELSLSDLATEVWAELSPAAPRASCTVEAGLKVWADPSLIRRVLENLLTNAIKFTAVRERPSIEVGSAADGEQVCLFVRDNGVGFDMRQAEGRLFTPYGRLHQSADFNGTGLGLSGSRRIVERHGGRMWACGVPNNGATFFFTLPDSHGARTAPASAT